MENQILKNVKFLVLDFDGVFTDNKVIVNEDGDESVICNRSDGIGLKNLKELEIEILVLSIEPNPVVSKRYGKLQIPYIQECQDKWEVLQKALSEKNIDLKNVAYVGNDINGILCMKNVGIPICVADAYP